MAKHKHAKSGRPTKGEGPKLSNPEEVERLLVEGEVVPDEHGEAKRVWLTQRDVAARFGVAVSTSTCGRAEALSVSAPRCSTPNRCCSSITTTPSDENSTASWMSACVPTTMSISPDARPPITLRR